MAAQHTSGLQALLVSSGFEGEVYAHEPMARHTSYHLGGPARFFVQVASLRALSALIEACRDEQEPWLVIGKGSNLLVADSGFEGVVITLGHDFKFCRFDEDALRFVAGAGLSLAHVVQDAFKRGVAGLEFAVGTPGTVGGAVRMNAGSRDEWIGSRVVSVTVYSPTQGLKRLAGSQIAWSYRETGFSDEEVILECELAVEASLPAYVRGRMEGVLARRKRTQPLQYPSCGSVFKNPPARSAGALIDGLGLKGLRHGGAMVSPLHANFIVNMGNARAADVYGLIRHVQTKVKEAYGIELQPEVKFLGFA
ncbi:MAG: UDP-N-acetylmuramate dehydrogenase [Coriobacteriaceae bacterium]|jgi:UDP-N-acetylmuramate dehydrogenase|nr:UDP-N-acetylmuramate dehydrogenase [Coriobacteriaceae bacterium]